MYTKKSPKHISIKVGTRVQESCWKQNERVLKIYITSLNGIIH